MKENIASGFLSGNKKRAIACAIAYILLARNVSVADAAPIPLRTPCPGSALLDQARAAVSASDEERAIILYQRSIEATSDCMTNWPTSVPRRLYLDSGEAHFGLVLAFMDSRKSDALFQFNETIIDLESACITPPAKYTFDKADLNADISKLDDLVKYFPTAIDFSSLDKCRYPYDGSKTAPPRA